MGTSSARWAPTGGPWRAARGAARRYLAPVEAGAGVTAGEVIVRYVAAVGATSVETGPGWLAAFRRTRKAAQNLGAWLLEAGHRDEHPATSALDLGALAGQRPEVAAQALSAALVGPGFDLEAEAARASLAPVLLRVLSSSPGISPPDNSASAPPAPQLVQEFLRAALCQRLVLDLGAVMEEAAAGAERLQSCLEEFHICLAEAGAAFELTDPPPASPGQWRGLAGWTWVTRVLEELVHLAIKQT